MIYTTTERNNAVLLIAAGKADLKNSALYERLKEFNWIRINRLNGRIYSVELTYAGKNLYRRLQKVNNQV